MRQFEVRPIIHQIQSKSFYLYYDELFCSCWRMDCLFYVAQCIGIRTSEGRCKPFVRTSVSLLPFVLQPLFNNWIARVVSSEWKHSCCLFFKSEGVVRYLSLMFTTFGVMTIQIAFRQYKLKSFLGFAEEKNEFKINGILKLVRHPIYSGLTLITIGFFLFMPNLPSLISCLSLFIYLPIGIYLEEKKLIATFGERYRQYKKTVSALVPRLPLNR